MSQNSCLVLNASFQPLNAITEEEAIIILLDSKAWVLEENKNKPYRSQYLTIYAPKIIVLNHFARANSFKIKPEKITRRNVLKRDQYRCQYCGRHRDALKSYEIMNVDHIIPRFQGGKDEWLNVVAACSSCNTKKSNQTPEQAGMKLISNVRIPVTWTIRGKSLLSEEQIRFVEGLLKIRKQTVEDIKKYLNMVA